MIDTLVVIICLAVNSPKKYKTAHVPVDHKQIENRFAQAFKEASEASDVKFQSELERLTDTSQMDAIIEKLKRKTVKP